MRNKKLFCGIIAAQLVFGAAFCTAFADEADVPAAALDPADTSAPAVQIKDGKTGVQLEAKPGVLPEGTEIKVGSSPKIKDEAEMFAYEITLSNGGEEIQPDGSVTVTVPVPEAYKDIKTLNVYRIEANGKYKFISSELKDGVITFTADHFSTYVFSARKLDEDGSPSTGVALAVAPVMLAASAAAVCLKKRR